MAGYLAVTSDAARHYAHLLAQTLGILGGYSGGANLAAAVHLIPAALHAVILLAGVALRQRLGTRGLHRVAAYAFGGWRGKGWNTAARSLLSSAILG